MHIAHSTVDSLFFILNAHCLIIFFNFELYSDTHHFIRIDESKSCKSQPAIFLINKMKSQMIGGFNQQSFQVLLQLLECYYFDIATYLCVIELFNMHIFKIIDFVK